MVILKFLATRISAGSLECSTIRLYCDFSSGVEPARIEQVEGSH
ncbi:hypothetical protein ACFY3U_27215 [Micromonospora sp. NPDC000089]